MIDPNELAEWAATCAAIAEDAGLLELPHEMDDAEADRMMTLYSWGMTPNAAAHAMYARH
ncbi:hypothetical protein [Burkholderia pseudomallei]|uniref:hypothetical protein n=1 Tax=Burkholderia pseudomallei TaxID=28450 RepID=UPI00100BCE09|nr:hypothetical protein [Burkholderia pseudomallei]